MNFESIDPAPLALQIRYICPELFGGCYFFICNAVDILFENSKICIAFISLKFMIKILDKKPDVLTIQEVAEILSVSLQTLRRWDNLGILKAFRVNEQQQRRYRKDQIIAYLESSPKADKDNSNAN